MTATTDIEPVLAGALQALRDKPDLTLEDLAAQVAAAPPAPVTPEAKPFPDLPKHATLSAEVLASVKNLPKVFNSVEISERRALTKKEIAAITAERVLLTQIGTALATRDKIIAETIRVHMDVDAEESGLAIPADKTDPATGQVIVAATPRDQAGHYLLAGPQQPHQVQAGPVQWAQEYSAAAPAPSDGALQQAYADGEISREDYLAVTREVRSFDAIRARELIRSAPARGLAVLRRITVGGTPRSSLYLRKLS